jgi:hypothetical protein
MRRRPPEKGEGGTRYTIKSLRLDIEAAEAGKTWLLLPEGYRDARSGLYYPLPSRRLELQKLAAIYLPPHAERRNSGCFYIRRCIREWTKRQQKSLSAVLDVAQRQHKVQQSHATYEFNLNNLKKDAKKAIEEVRQEAALQIASLNDLFALGRKGIEGQMRAHLAEDEKERKWRGEEISAKDFRDCFRMVTQAVKGLGMPSEQRAKAEDAIFEECAEALRSTQAILSMSPAESDPTIKN